MSLAMKVPCLFSKAAVLLAWIQPDRFKCMNDAETMEYAKPRTIFMALFFAVMCATIVFGLLEVFSGKMKTDKKVPKPSNDIIEI
ncbi:unnamed protein product [Orchesella dallaii]|uniref:Uncharacterized protein n=1 Tax=Orchesella dallaii TaxID=48710 RepID=A0ABP1PMK6_9HEXA